MFAKHLFVVTASFQGLSLGAPIVHWSDMLHLKQSIRTNGQGLGTNVGDWRSQPKPYGPETHKATKALFGVFHKGI